MSMAGADRRRRLLVVNPNSNPLVTRLVDAAAQAALPPGYMPPPQAPPTGRSRSRRPRTVPRPCPACWA
ncbi:MAG: hypothetical protein R3D25_04385 [Geminicoccaceae bacterium]